MPRGVTPTRVRRRQSDAKWRASVAMCYNIMKYVIPNQKMMRRRKVSKAFTLKETERHIVNLEKKLREIIEDRAPMNGKVVMLDTDGGPRLPATFENIKNVFAERQYTYFANNTTSGKKRYNIPADIEASLLNMSHQACKVNIANRSQIHVPTSSHTRPFHVGNDKKHVDLSQNGYSKKPLENLLGSVDMLRNESHITLEHQTPSKNTIFPSFLAQQAQTYNQASTVRKEATPRTPTLKKRTGQYSTPKQHMQHGYRTGFTPVKLPSGVECRDLLTAFSTTPTKSSLSSPVTSLPQTPGQCLNYEGTFEVTDEESSSSLLCYESINFEDSIGFRKTWSQQDFMVPDSEDILDTGLNDCVPFYESYIKDDRPREAALSSLLSSLSPSKDGLSPALTSDSMDLPSDLVATDIKPLTKHYFDTDLVIRLQMGYQLPSVLALVFMPPAEMSQAFAGESFDDLACLFMGKDVFQQSDLVPTMQQQNTHIGFDAERSTSQDCDLLVPDFDVA